MLAAIEDDQHLLAAQELDHFIHRTTGAGIGSTGLLICRYRGGHFRTRIAKRTGTRGRRFIAFGWIGGLSDEGQESSLRQFRRSIRSHFPGIGRAARGARLI